MESAFLHLRRNPDNAPYWIRILERMRALNLYFPPGPGAINLFSVQQEAVRVAGSIRDQRLEAWLQQSVAGQMLGKEKRAPVTFVRSHSVGAASA